MLGVGRISMPVGVAVEPFPAESVPLVGVGRIALVRSPTMPPKTPLWVLEGVGVTTGSVPLVPLAGAVTGAGAVLLGRRALVRPPTTPPRRPLCVLVALGVS